ncbi:MAG: epoxyqueuosine reductase QueH [candidate division WOR-3 bacterium]|nr:epoxyqueuosine reductase QueH [candidate division WOR-3 bacterium]MCX7757288.1 epoxyqueuosine reductase QueH [candidate division WOR-3 bacterium]MDW7988120.1 epoxyqueuosine reductase QueH [candidate division WOR-3 bacterium]
MSNKLLLHICCAICANRAIEQLKSKFEIIGFFYNPNIEPVSEYQKRLEAANILANYYNIPIIIGEYENQLWRNKIKGYEDYPENSIRCEICFKIRLEKTAEMCFSKNIQNFATTLTTSHHKNSTTLNMIGQKIAAAYKFNFILISGYNYSRPPQQLNLYRQKYCGCIFSLNTYFK